jgi:predicted dithiol-disulfide oxidoreductase (DUF899 family)
MPDARPPVVSRTEWDAALAAITEREKTVATAMHELAAARKRMPMVRVEHDYRFEGPEGQRSLSELFGGRRQLIHMFFRDGDDVFRTYFLQHGEMVQTVGSVWSMMSLTPYGAQSEDEDVPEGWPQAPFSFWFRRHDEFDGSPPPSAGT